MNINEELIVERFQKVAEVFARVFVKALNVMRDFIKAKWETIKEYVMSYEPMYKKPVHPAFKARTMSRYTIRSQMMVRKPMFIRGRTIC